MVLFGRALKFRSISTQTHTGVPHMYPFEAVALKFPTVPDLVKAHVLCVPAGQHIDSIAFPIK